MKNSWIKIEDEHPKASLKQLLICLNGQFTLKARYAAFYSDTSPTFWLDDDLRFSNEWEGYTITHWQPIELPE